MKYVALLRGINVGGNKKVEMKKLKAAFELSGYSNVATYINSGNVIFESTKGKDAIRREAEKLLEKEFGFKIQTLVKTESEMRKIAEAIPINWQNDTIQRTDVAYLFDDVDRKSIITELPVNREYIDVRYVKGAIFWNFDRKNYSKSRLNNLIGHRMYQFMTVRNVNTARFLANYK